MLQYVPCIFAPRVYVGADDAASIALTLHLTRCASRGVGVFLDRHR